MGRVLNIDEVSNDPTTNIAIDTIKLEKQALVFCNSKRSAEAQAERISKLTKGKPYISQTRLQKVADDLLHDLSTATKQCKRLSNIVQGGIAFHHAGLTPNQRAIIEDNFKEGTIKVICATPTLAAGVNIPAFRTVIRDLKRFAGGWGMKDIQVLEYHQMAGRSGRPDFNDEFGEAICIAKSASDIQEIYDKFINAPPEEIFSKLAVEPVLRVFVLSLISTKIVQTKAELIDFFSETFYASQFGDMHKIKSLLERMILLLGSWGFLNIDGVDTTVDEEEDAEEDEDGDYYDYSEFESADNLGDSSSKAKFTSGEVPDDSRISATLLGHRIARLYLDPLTAHDLITCAKRSKSTRVDEFSIIQACCTTNEMRPLVRAKNAEYELYEEKMAEREGSFLTVEPSMYEPEYQEYVDATKTALMLNDYIDEKDEEYILETYSVRPGELRYKLDRADWLLYSWEEISEIMNNRDLKKMVSKSRFRLRYGAKEELFPLLKIKNIGRVRARNLFRNGIRTIGDVKSVPLTTLAQLLGAKMAVNIKKEVGEDVSKVKIPERKRKGQISLEDFHKRKAKK